MLALARPADPVFEEVDLVEVLTQTARLVEPTARKSRVEIESHFPNTAPRRRADPNQLKQVFLNAMMNAVQAMPDGGKLSVSVSRLGRTPGELQWKVEIADTGAGIPQEHQERIFDPFFTTKRDGTGLGLSICHAILEAHGGQIQVDSIAGQGTRVEIRL
jgi:signal transduction histidine kinase